MEAERFAGLLWTGLCVFGLIVAFGLLGLTTVRLRSWFRDGDGPADDADTFLSAMLDSQRQGVVSPEEFRSIHGEMVRRRPGSSSDSGPASPAVADSPDGPGRNAPDETPFDEDAPDENALDENALDETTQESDAANRELELPDTDRTRPKPIPNAQADATDSAADA